MTIEYLNPVWPGYAADPYILSYGGEYFIYATARVFPSPENASVPGPRGYFYSYGTATIQGRHFVILKSRDLVRWECRGGGLEPLPEFAEVDHWAPEVVAREGKFLMYYSVDQSWGGIRVQRTRIAMAEHPEGPFRDTGKLLLPEEGFTIDASPFRDPVSGKWYAYFAKDFLEGERPGTGIAVVEVSDDLMTARSEPTVVVRASADWQVSGRNRRMYGRDFAKWHTVEGPQVMFRDGKYYCFYSGGAWYRADRGVSVAVAPHPLGPWEDLSSAGGPTVIKNIPGKVCGPGHLSLLSLPDSETVLCFYNVLDESLGIRQICLDPVEWTPDGPRVTPTFEPKRILVA